MIYWIIGGLAVFVCGWFLGTLLGGCRSCYEKRVSGLTGGADIPATVTQITHDRLYELEAKVKTLENQASRGIFDSIKVIIEKSGVHIRPGYSGATSTESGDHCTMQVAELLETILESYEKVSVKPASGFELKLKVKK